MAQEDIPKAKNAIFIELLGNSVYWYNLTYDRIIFSSESLNISTGIGVQYLGDRDKFIGDHSTHHDAIGWGLAPQISLLFPSSQTSSFELGIGVTIFEPISTNDIFIPLRMGYRYQAHSRGIFFKLAVTSIKSFGGVVFFEDVSYWIPIWPSLAMGVSF